MYFIINCWLFCARSFPSVFEFTLLYFQIHSSSVARTCWTRFSLHKWCSHAFSRELCLWSADELWDSFMWVHMVNTLMYLKCKWLFLLGFSAFLSLCFVPHPCPCLSINNTDEVWISNMLKVWWCGDKLRVKFWDILQHPAIKASSMCRGNYLVIISADLDTTD